MTTMKIGVGLPAAIEGVSQEQLLAWACEAEGTGATTLCCTDRVMYPCLESLLTLAAVSSVTHRANLMTSVLVAPLRTDSALFRKQVHTLDTLTGHRLILGVGVGRRTDDYDACGISFRDRGKILDQQLTASSPPSPSAAPTSIADELGPRLLFGGQSEPTLGRIAQYGGGWVAAGGLGGWQATAQFAGEVREAWSAGGRAGKPRLIAMIYTAAGPTAREDAQRHIGSYYGFLGPERSSELAEFVIADPSQLIDTRDQIAAAGFDELLLLPTSADLAQLNALEIALG
jgi:alkanesulfonate monooxygenase SsuD/methylene tetrahydromethanopterin reductase-like flavin-dependent oxidoreductase (luciferase family)